MNFPQPNATCDGGDLDCGSGLLLIIKKSMDPLDSGQILEVRSTDKTVADDLPAWCRMVEHEFIGARPNEADVSYFIRKGGAGDDLRQDLEAARGYRWATRIRAEAGSTAKVYNRNHSFKAGQPADFSEKVDHPSAIDYLLAALGSCLTVGFQLNCSREKMIIDAAEFSLNGGLDNVLFHMGLEDTGSPALSDITGVFYVSSPEEEAKLKEVWQLTLERSPVYQTLRNQVNISIELSIVF